MSMQIACYCQWKEISTELNSLKLQLLFFFSPQSCPTLWSHRPQPAILSCPSLSLRVCSSSRSLSQWCHLTSSSSLLLFSPPALIFSASGFFPVIWLFTSCSQSIGFSASASVLPMNIQGWFLIRLIGLICSNLYEIVIWINSNVYPSNSIFSCIFK